MPSALTFTRRTLPRLATPRANAAAIALADGRVAVLGGGTRREGVAPGACELACYSSNAVELVDVARESIASAAPLHWARESAQVFSWEGRLVLLGGIADHG